jgi:hypothetical protein
MYWSIVSYASQDGCKFKISVEKLFLLLACACLNDDQLGATLLSLV